MAQETEKCIFCKSNCNKTATDGNHTLDTYICAYCGEYIISQRDCLHDLSADDKFKIACVLNEYRLRDQNIPPDKKPVYCISTSEKAKDTVVRIYKTAVELVADYPKMPQEILARGLVNLSRLVSEPFSFIYYKEILLRSSLFSKYSYIQTISELANSGYLAIDNPDAPLISTLGGSNPDIFNRQQPPTPRRFNITGKGWEYVNRVSSRSDKVFVAMWFSGEETKGIFEIIKEAATRAGYEAERVDQVHHNDYIMDKVLNMIDESKFVIVDYTTIPETAIGNVFKNGIRGGVYFEAGYARGKGKPVINLCRDDTADRLHFDVTQLSQIRWKKENIADAVKREQLIDIITQRIIQTVGRFN